MKPAKNIYDLDSIHLHCVQCGEMIFEYLGSPLTFICNNEKCPNYGLLQAGIENMPMDDYDRN
jgi:hypothetical protein